MFQKKKLSFLEDLGIRDSKKLTDEFILANAPILAKKTNLP